MTVIVRCVVHQYLQRTKIFLGGSHGRLQRLDINKIDMMEDRHMSGFTTTSFNGLERLCLVDVGKGHLAALTHEMFDGGAADPIGATGYEHGAVHE